MKRVLAGILGTLVLAFATSASAQTLRIGAKAEPVMDPHYQWSDVNMAYYKHIFGGLTSTNSDSQVVPGLATTWENTSPNEWVFHLRKDAKFQDGAPVLAGDVVASFDRMRTIKAAATYAGAVSGLKEVQAVDDHTVKLVFDSPNALAPIQASLIQIIPAKFASATGEDFASGKAVVGFGPYRLAQFRAGESITLERNPDYFGEPAKWERVTFRFMADPGARVAALLGGDVDFIDAVPPSLVDRIRNEKGYRVITGPSGRTIYLTIDTDRDSSPFVTDKDGKPMSVNPLKDVRVRRALTHAVDRAAIAQRVMGGLAFPTGQITPKGFGGYDPEIGVPKYDPDLSRKLLSEAGYPDGFGLTIHCTNDRHVEDAKICQALGQMFTRVGLKMNVETMPSAVMTPRAMDPKGDRFSLAMIGWSDSSGEARILSFCLHTPDGRRQGTWNWGRYSNAVLDGLIDEAGTLLDAGARHAKLRQAMRIAMDDAAVIPLHYQSVVVAAREGLSYRTWVNEYTMADSVSVAAK